MTWRLAEELFPREMIFADNGHMEEVAATKNKLIKQVMQYYTCVAEFEADEEKRNEAVADPNGNLKAAEKWYTDNSYKRKLSVSSAAAVST